MNQKELPLKFEQIRTFGQVFSDTRKLIRENFSVFFRTILFLVGPFALLSCTLQTFYEVKIIGGHSHSWYDIDAYGDATTIYKQLRWILNGLLTAVVVSHFMKVYREKGPGKFDVNDVTKSIFSDFGGSFVTVLLVLIVVVIFAAALLGLLYGVGELSPGAGVLMVVLGCIGYVLLRFPLWYFAYGLFHARLAEPGRRNPFSALQLAGSVFVGNWWNTWAVFFVLWLLLMVIGYVIALPETILSMMTNVWHFDPTSDPDIDWKLVDSILTSIGEFARTLIYSVFSAAIALHFYSLKEKKDGLGTTDLLEQIGKNKEDDNIELTY